MPDPPRQLGGLVGRGCQRVGARQSPDPSAGALPVWTLAVASRRDKRPSGGRLAIAATGQPDCNPMWPGLPQRLCKVPIISTATSRCRSF